MEVVNEEVMNIADTRINNLRRIVEHAQIMDAVTAAIEDLPEREQLVMQLYYVEELNLKEIGEVLGVSESRVSQILSTVVKKLRGNLKALLSPCHLKSEARDEQFLPNVFGLGYFALGGAVFLSD
jgi:RNA polymerase sigma factor for flagellar operon FliA